MHGPCMVPLHGSAQFRLFGRWTYVSCMGMHERIAHVWARETDPDAASVIMHKYHIIPRMHYTPSSKKGPTSIGHPPRHNLRASWSPVPQTLVDQSGFVCSIFRMNSRSNSCKMINRQNLCRFLWFGFRFNWTTCCYSFGCALSLISQPIQLIKILELKTYLMWQLLSSYVFDESKHLVYTKCSHLIWILRRDACLWHSSTT